MKIGSPSSHGDLVSTLSVEAAGRWHGNEHRSITECRCAADMDLYGLVILVPIRVNGAAEAAKAGTRQHGKDWFRVPGSGYRLTPIGQWRPAVADPPPHWHWQPGAWQRASNVAVWQCAPGGCTSTQPTALLRRPYGLSPPIAAAARPQLSRVFPRRSITYESATLPSFRMPMHA